MDNNYNTFHVQRDKGRMATIVVKFITSWLYNLIGGSLFGLWLLVDFNEVKMIIVGCIGIVWATLRGALELYRTWIKAERERYELDKYKRDNKEKDKPPIIKIKGKNQ